MKFLNACNIFFLLSICHFFSLNAANSPSCLNHPYPDKIKNEMRDKVKNSKTLFGFTFLMCNDDDSLNEIVKENYGKYRRIVKRLQGGGDLAPHNLEYFHQFNERFYLTRQASAITVDQNIINHNWRLRNKECTPKRTQERIEETLLAFYEACARLDQLQAMVTTTFSDYYACGCSKRTLAVIHDHGLLELSLGNVDRAIALADELISAASVPPNSNKFLSSEYALSIGITYAQALNYSKAIEYLSESIRQDPNNKEAYLERAIAYFETNKIAEAKDDFSQLDIKELLARPLDSSHKQFSSGFLLGAPDGLKDGAIELPISLWYSLQGASHLLWATASNPLEVPERMINAVWQIMDYFKTQDISQIAEDLAPEFHELVKYWEFYDSYTKGQKTGHLLGKYGVDILALYACGAAGQAFRELRSTNALCNLEMMALSDVTEQGIIQLAQKQAAERSLYFKKAKYNYDAHNKHVPGHNDFASTRSIWHHSDPEGLFRKFAGKGIPTRGTPGMAGFKETVDFGEHIGVWVSEDGLVSLLTTRGTIHYSKKGGHIVPSNPNPLIIKK